jgi:hypothetical protein
VRRLLVGMVGGVVVTLLVIVLLLVGLDRLAAYEASHVVADRVRTAEHLQQTPQVTIRGFPFLTQVVHGRLRDVDVVARDVPADGLHFATVSAHLRGVHLDLSRLLHRQRGGVRIDAGTAEASLPFTQLDSYAAARGTPLTFAAAGDLLAVTGHLTVVGQRFSVTGDAQVAVAGAVLTIRLASLSGSVSALVARLLRVRLDYRVQTGRLPFGFRLRSVQVTPAGLVLRAAATELDGLP